MADPLVRIQRRAGPSTSKFRVHSRKLISLSGCRQCRPSRRMYCICPRGWALPSPFHPTFLAQGPDWFRRGVRVSIASSRYACPTTLYWSEIGKPCWMQNWTWKGWKSYSVGTMSAQAAWSDKRMLQCSRLVAGRWKVRSLHDPLPSRSWRMVCGGRFASAAVLRLGVLERGARYQPSLSGKKLPSASPPWTHSTRSSSPSFRRQGQTVS